jgi:hypothetical protein
MISAVGGGEKFDETPKCMFEIGMMVKSRAQHP